MNYIKSFFSFKGRLGREHFFYGHLVISLAMLTVTYLISFFDSHLSTEAYAVFRPFSPHQNYFTDLSGWELLAFIMFCGVDSFFTLALFSKRIRDVGFSPYWSTVIFIPFVGQLAFILGYFVKGREIKQTGEGV